jgi:choline dehydrogenase-like flavoprotein
MEHPKTSCAKLVTSLPLGSMIEHFGLYYQPGFAVAEETQRTHRLLNHRFAFERSATHSGASATASFAVKADLEQAPDHGSRIQLNRERDALGLRRVLLSYKLSGSERRTLRSSLLELRRRLALSNLGRLHLDDWLLDDTNSMPITFQGHQMGTTRMSNDPRQGVVDEHCRVHTISNLYVAGSSIFPTGGSANPTLTIVALALRLADRLKKASPGP